MVLEAGMATRALVACFVLATGTVGFAQVTRSAPSSRSADTQPRTSILCGTRVFDPDSSIDPKIAKTPPSGAFTLRTLRPPVCRDTFSSPLTELKQRLPTFLGPKR
jgi:hypothetical protein